MTAGRRSLLALAPLLVAGAAAAQDPKPRPEPRPRTPLDTVRPRTPADTVRPRLPADTLGGRTRAPGGTPLPANAPGATGRYRVTLNGITVHRQTYDNPLQTDGKGDEVYVAAYVAKVDTAAPMLVEHAVVRSREYGDVNGFAERLRAGSLDRLGGIRTTDRFPTATPHERSRAPSPDVLPMVLWEGTLTQGQSAIVVTPTVWEWDGNPELFAYWVTSRGVLLERLLEPRVVLSMLGNLTFLPQELGSPGFVIRTNTVADPRDRPIGLGRGRAAADAGFVEPQVTPATSAVLGFAGNVLAALKGKVSAVVRAMYHVVSRATGTARGAMVRKVSALFEAVLGRIVDGGFLALFGGAEKGTTPAKGTVPAGKGELPWDAATDDDAKAILRAGVDSITKGGTARVRVPVFAQLVAGIKPALPDPRSRDFHFFEKALVLTPAAIHELYRSFPTGRIDVPYVDDPAFSGRYMLHLQVERLP